MVENLDDGNWSRSRKNMGEVKPWDLIRPSNRIPEDIAFQRLDICKSCPELIKLTATCKKCGCFMKLKTHLKYAECPLSKW
jgi:hypothetical protein